MSNPDVRNIHVDAILSEPVLVDREGTEAFGIIVSVDGEHAALTMPVEAARWLAHAIDAGHLPDMPEEPVIVRGIRKWQ